MDLYSRLLALFKERNYVNAENIVPYYACSLGTHVFNLRNKDPKKDPIFTDQGEVPDLRLHIFMVTVPGFGKSLTINMLTRQKYGLLADTLIKSRKMNEVSAAGLVGTIKTTQDGDVVTHKGMLYKYAEYIIASEEFSSVTASGKQAHSTTLMNILLMALDSGEVVKDLSGSGLDYITFATFWAAVQPQRYELATGFPRRFLFIVFMPTLEDVKAIRKARELNQNLVVNLKFLLEFKAGLEERMKQIDETLKFVEYSKEYREWLNSKNNMHYEDMLFDRIALGYWLMKSEVIGEKLVIGIDDELKRIIELQMKYRLEIQKGVQKIKIWELIKNYKTIALDEVINLLVKFSIEYDYIMKQLEVLKKAGAISVVDGVVHNLKHKEDVV